MVTPRQIIAPQQLTNAAAAYYTVPVNTTTIIKKLTFANTTGGAVTVTVYFSGSDAAHTVKMAKSLAAGETWECYEAENHILPAAATIQLVCSANTAVTAIGSGLEIV